jgi:hypothetical protein
MKEDLLDETCSLGWGERSDTGYWWWDGEREVTLGIGGGMGREK